MVARLRQTLIAVVVVILVLPLVAASALAAPNTDSWSFSSRGLSASADSYECSTSGDLTTCTGTGVYVFSGTRREQGTGAVRATEVCYFSYTDVYNTATGESVSFSQEDGCTTDVGAGTVIERDLSSATIAPTTITVQTLECDHFECTPTGDTREVVVEGTFTAISPARRESYRSTYDDGVCTYRDSFRGTSRTASFSGTINGEAMEISGDSEFGYSQIGSGMHSSSGRCDLEA